MKTEIVELKKEWSLAHQIWLALAQDMSAYEDDPAWWEWKILDFEFLWTSSFSFIEIKIVIKSSMKEDLGS